MEVASGISNSLAPPRLVWRRLLFGLLLIWGAVLLIYGQTLGHSAIAYDDFTYLPQERLALFTDILTKPVVNLWHPLTVLSHRLADRAFGDAYGLHHFINVLLHGAAASFLFFWLARSRREDNYSAFFCALLWAVHPMAVEPVAWISGRKDVLLAVLVFGGMAAATDRRGRFIAMLFFLLAFLVKPLAVVIPGLLLASLYWPGGMDKFGKQWVRRTALGLLGASVIVAAITIYFQAQGSHGLATPKSIEARTAGALWGIGEYFVRWFYPLRLHLGYEDLDLVSAGRIGATALIVLAAFAFAWNWRGRGRQPSFFAGLLWFFIPLLPTLGLLRAGNSLVADRYFYLPSLGLLLFFVPPLLASRRLRPIVASVLMLGAVLLGILSHRQTETWRSTESVFEHVLSIDPGHALANSKFGERLVLEGGDSEVAREYLNRALARRPEDPAAHLHLGILDAKDGQFEGAVAHYKNALRHWPQIAWIRANLAGSLWATGARIEAWTILDQTDQPVDQPLWLHRERIRLLGSGPNEVAFSDQAEKDLRRVEEEYPELQAEIIGLLGQLPPR